MSASLAQSADFVAASSQLTPAIFAKGPGKSDRGWQRVFLVTYAGLALLFVALGMWGFAACYVALSVFFALQGTDLDLFAPMSLVAHAFGIYFLLPLSLISDRASATLTYITSTLILTLILYLLLPRLNFGFGRWLDEDLTLRKSILRVAALMQLIGFAGFFVSTRLAGYSNPFGVFITPVKYRFFMMVGGMTYATQLLNFLLLTPALIVAVSYYMGSTSRKAFLCTVAAALFYGLATGSRGAPIGLLLEILLVRHILRKRISITLVLIILCITIPFMAIAGQYRVVKYINQNVTFSDVVSKLDFTDVLKIAFSRLDAAGMFNDLIVAYRQQNPKLGLSYIELPIEAIPRKIWPTKPRLPNPQMTRIVGRNDPNLDISFDFGIFGETFINFLWLGVFAGALMIVLIAGPMQCVYEFAKKRRNPMCILFCSLLCFTPISLVVAGLAETLILGSFSLLQLLTLRLLFFRKRSRMGSAPAWRLH